MFTLISPNSSGVKFKNLVRETTEFNVLEYGYLYNGGGVSIGDINNDGLSDIYFTGNMVGSHLYLNQGDFKFKEIAKEAGVFAEGLWNTGTTMADINGDGYLDIYVCRSAAKDPSKRKNLLFINNQDLTFTESASDYNIDDSGYSTQATFFDYDRDGDLDLYVLNHSTQEYAGFGQITATLKNKKNPAYSDKFYKNNKGKFKEVGQEIGLISNVLGFGLGIAVSDINNDGWPDVFISNDYNEQDYLYINNQDGTFAERLEQFIGHTSLFSMGSDIADINNDGFFDIMTLDMLPEGNTRQKMVSGPDNYDKYSLLAQSGFYNQTMRNMLQLNNQGQSFSEIGQLSGISNTDWSWASLFMDLDLDGYKDLFITNGYKRDYTNMDFMNYAVQQKLNENKTGERTAIMELLEKIPSTVEENYTYKNEGNLSFKKVNIDWGLNQKSLSNGAAYADLDNDGDLDMVVNNLEEAAFLYRNNSEIHNDNHYIKIKLNGQGMNVFGIGAKVALTIDEKTLVQELMPTRGYQSSVDFNLVFGLGDAEIVDQLTITWPDGKTQRVENIKADQTLELNQKEASISKSKIKSTTPALFVDLKADSLLNYHHRENNFVDFKREQLLPHKLSTQGPKIAKADVNNNGLMDVFIGGAKGSPGALYLQNRSGKFIESQSDAFLADVGSEDIGVLFFDADGDKDQDLYIVSGGNDFEINAKELQDRLYLNNGKGVFRKNVLALPPMLTSGSAVTAGDLDNDGDLDLFVGGRLVPGRYPTAPRSFVLINDGMGKFADNTAMICPDLVNPGMVTDAIWTDFDNDQKEDLLLVGEFMGIRAFKNSDGKLAELKGDTGLRNSEGWWNSLEQGDFDNDGDMDYIVGNFGLNSQLKASPKEPVTLYTKDFDHNGSLDPILCSFILGKDYPVFSKDDLVGQLSGLKSKYVNYVDYADQQITDVFTSEELKDVEILRARNFASSYLENLGNGKFELTPLPGKAQFSPVYGILPKDFNGDGNLDLLLGGNFYGNRVKFGRYDANKGLVLLGDGTGTFEPIHILESGLQVEGEVRDIMGIDLADKSQLILMVRNNMPIKIYKINSNKALEP